MLQAWLLWTIGLLRLLMLIVASERNLGTPTKNYRLGSSSCIWLDEETVETAERMYNFTKPYKL